VQLFPIRTKVNRRIRAWARKPRMGPMRIRNTDKKWSKLLKHQFRAKNSRTEIFFKCTQYGTVPVRMNDPQRSVQNHHHSHQLGSNLNKRKIFCQHPDPAFFGSRPILPHWHRSWFKNFKNSTACASKSHNLRFFYLLIQPNPNLGLIQRSCISKPANHLLLVYSVVKETWSTVHGLRWNRLKKPQGWTKFVGIKIIMNKEDPVQWKNFFKLQSEPLQKRIILPVH
jgi:hypothetical protein